MNDIYDLARADWTKIRVLVVVLDVVGCYVAFKIFRVTGKNSKATVGEILAWLILTLVFLLLAVYMGTVMSNLRYQSVP